MRNLFGIFIKNNNIFLVNLFDFRNRTSRTIPVMLLCIPATASTQFLHVYKEFKHHFLVYKKQRAPMDPYGIRGINGINKLGI